MRPPEQPTPTDAKLDELRAIRRELTALRKLFDHFAGVFLNAKFQYGKPIDRWTRQ
jgi:hypothetical protein